MRRRYREPLTRLLFLPCSLSFFIFCPRMVRYRGKEKEKTPTPRGRASSTTGR